MKNIFMSHSESGSSLTKQPQVIVSPDGGCPAEILFLVTPCVLSTLLTIDPQPAATAMKILTKPCSLMTSSNV